MSVKVPPMSMPSAKFGTRATLCGGRSYVKRAARRADGPLLQASLARGDGREPCEARDQENQGARLGDLIAGRREIETDREIVVAAVDDERNPEPGERAVGEAEQDLAP